MIEQRAIGFIGRFEIEKNWLSNENIPGVFVSDRCHTVEANQVADLME